MSARAACDRLVEEVKTSNLNFVVKETPYSVFITLRKSFAKTTENINDDDASDKKESNLQNEYNELQGKYEDKLKNTMIFLKILKILRLK